MAVELTLGQLLKEVADGYGFKGTTTGISGVEVAIVLKLGSLLSLELIARVNTE